MSDRAKFLKARREAKAKERRDKAEREECRYCKEPAAWSKRFNRRLTMCREHLDADANRNDANRRRHAKR
jgi:hypothetical protein